MAQQQDIDPMYVSMYCTLHRSKLLLMSSSQDFLVKSLSLSVFPLFQIT